MVLKVSACIFKNRDNLDTDYKLYKLNSTFKPLFLSNSTRHKIQNKLDVIQAVPFNIHLR